MAGSGGGGPPGRTWLNRGTKGLGGDSGQEGLVPPHSPEGRATEGAVEAPDIHTADTASAVPQNKALPAWHPAL